LNTSQQCTTTVFVLSCLLNWHCAALVAVLENPPNNSGTFRVTSRYHASKYKAGQFQMAFPTNPDDLVSHDSLTDKAYVAKANQVNLEFLKTDAY
jgi:hypothetical protein